MISRNGAGLRLLTGPIASPTLARVIGEVLAAYPGAAWHQHDPLADDVALAGAVAAFSEPVAVLPDLARARGAVPRGGPARRGTGAAPADAGLDREAGRAAGQLPALVVADASPSVIGARAARRIVLDPQEAEPFARAVAAALGVPGLAAGGAHPEAESVAALLRVAGSDSVVLAGRGQAPAVHALAHAMNGALGAVVRYIPHPLARPEPMGESLRARVAALAAGEVTHLVMSGVNPAYDAPAALGFVPALARAPFTLHLGQDLNKTAHLCRWHAPLLARPDAALLAGLATAAQMGALGAFLTLAPVRCSRRPR